MRFNSHYALSAAGSHAFLSASKYAWINYDEEKLGQSWATARAAERGTRLHNLARELIELGIKQPRNNTTLSLYVNDAIGFRMTPEQYLFYSENAYGCADAISFRKERTKDLRPILRVHDLKTGISPASFKQLMIYVAFFCLEYRENPFEIDIELRIYQNDTFETYIPDPGDIMHIMEQTRSFDKKIVQWRLEAAGLS